MMHVNVRCIIQYDINLDNATTFGTLSCGIILMLYCFSQYMLLHIKSVENSLQFDFDNFIEITLRQFHT